MSNQIILLPQKFKFSDLTSQFPGSGKLIKKVFFQAELRSLDYGNASFAIIGYPAWKLANGKWTIGKKVEGEPTGEGNPIPFVPPLAFANNELILGSKSAKKDKKKKAKKCKKEELKITPEKKLLLLVKKISKSKVLSEKTFFHFNARISENPHIEYDVMLDVDGQTLNVSTKPSPPARPQDAEA